MNLKNNIKRNTLISKINSNKINLILRKINQDRILNSSSIKTMKFKVSDQALMLLGLTGNLKKKRK